MRQMARGVAPLLALAVLAAAPCTAFASHGEPLRGQWHLDAKVNQGGPWDTADSSGHGNFLQSPREPSLVPGRFGNAFASTAGTAPTTTTAAADLESPEVTLVAWVRRSGDPGLYRNIASKGASGCDAASYALYTGRNEAPGVQFYVYGSNDSGTVFSPRITDPALWDGNWHMLVGTFDRYVARLYLDGVQVGDGSPRSFRRILYDLPVRNFSVGRYSNASCPLDGSFNGDIDEVRVYNRVLNGSEIRRLAKAPGPDPPVLEPDGDDDDNPDTGDNCPTTPNTDQLDSDGNGVGNACEPLGARFVHSPERSCVGSRTLFDATSSTAPGNPIVNYRFEYTQRTKLKRGDRERVVISDGPSPTASHYFGWNIPPTPTTSLERAFAHGFGQPLGDFHPAQRHDVVVDLRITDSTGRESTTSRTVSFAQHKADEPRTGCPRREVVFYLPPAPTKIKVLRKVVTVNTTCKGLVNCFGALTLARVVGRNVRGAAAQNRRRRPAVLLAYKTYTIPAGKSATVRAKLNKTARRLLRKTGRLRAKLSLSSVSPLGKPVVRSRTVTLKRNATGRR